MKVPITCTLDLELVEKLKREENYSNIINEQLLVFYNSLDTPNKGKLMQNLKETKAILKENRKKQREIEKKLEKIKQNELKCQVYSREKEIQDKIAARRRNII
jgi:hypothetical protein